MQINANKNSKWKKQNLILLIVTIRYIFIINTKRRIKKEISYINVLIQVMLIFAYKSV